MSFSPITLALYMDAARVSEVDLSTGMLVSDLITGSIDEVKTFNSYPQVVADSEIDVVTRAQAALWFAQQGAPRLKICKFDYDGAPSAIGAVLDAILAADAAWYGLLAGGTAASVVTKAYVIAIAAWALTNKRLYGALTCDADVLTATASNVADAIMDLGNDYTFLTYHDASDVLVPTAVMARGLGFNPDRRAATWGLMNPLPGVDACTGLDSTEITNLVAQNVNRVDTLDGVTCWGQYGKTCGGRAIKSRISADWFSARLQSRLAQLALDKSAQGGEGIPYTMDGIGLVRSQVEAQLDTGLRLGHFASLADEKADTTHTIRAPWTSFPTLGEISASDRAAKRLPFSCGFSAAGEVLDFSGAIYFQGA